jgi:hypothetical protein
VVKKGKGIRRAAEKAGLEKDGAAALKFQFQLVFDRTLFILNAEKCDLKPDFGRPSPALAKKERNAFLGSPDAQRRAHHDAHTKPSAMDSFAQARGRPFARPRRTTAVLVRSSSPQEAIPGLPDHLVVAHILRSGHFDDPADLARLPAVSRAMRDVVEGTGLRFAELDEKRAVELGCLSALYRRQRQGRLSSRKLLCQAAARSGQLEELKTLRANNTPWDSNTCSAAARGGHLEVLQWACANGCPWDKDTCAWATLGRHLKVLQWARANSCPCWERDLYVAAEMGHEVVVRVLIEASADVNEARDDGWTPLCTGAFHDHEAVVRVLIELGANVNKAVDDTETALYAAADRGHQAVVRALIEAGANVNKAREGSWTPIYVAA